MRWQYLYSTYSLQLLYNVSFYHKSCRKYCIWFVFWIIKKPHIIIVVSLFAKSELILLHQLCCALDTTNNSISYNKYLIQILTHTTSYLKRTIATASFMTLSPNTKAYRSTSTCRSWKMASTVTEKKITVILRLSLWWIYCTKGANKRINSERGNGKEQLFTTSDGVELPPNNLKLKEKLKMFEMVMVSSGYLELRANKQ